MEGDFWEWRQLDFRDWTDKLCDRTAVFARGRLLGEETARV